MGIKAQKTTTQVWPHFRTYRLLVKANETKTTNALAAALCILRDEQIPELVVARAWNLRSELDLERLAVAINYPRGTVKATVMQCLGKIAKLMLADPVRTMIDLAEADFEEMSPSEWDTRYRVQTGRVDRRNLHPFYSRCSCKNRPASVPTRRGEYAEAGLP